MITMSLIISTVRKEKQRIDYMLGKYRDGKKVVSKYIGKNDIEFTREQIEKRRHVEAMIQSLTEEQKLAEKVLEGKL